jgi:hypothetical protein
MVLPELAGIGAVPAWRAKHASVRNRSAPAVWPMRIAAVTGPHPRSVSSCGPQSGDDELSYREVHQRKVWFTSRWRPPPAQR